MGISLEDNGDLEAAIDSYKQAIKIKPDYAEAYNNMGIALKKKGDLKAAIDSYKHAIKIKPNYAGAYNNMGIALQDKGNLEAAIESYKQAIKIKPDYADAYYNMGISLAEQGDLKAAIDSYKHAIKIKPDYDMACTLKLHQQAHICDWAGIEEDQHLISQLGTSTQHISPLGVLALEDAPDRHLLRSAIYAKNLFKQKPLPLEAKPSHKPDRLRIGYFSVDFGEHPVSRMLVRALELHNRERFEIYAYSFGADGTSAMRQRIKNAVDVFVDATKMSDRDIALLARQDKIDIAIDLTGYTKNNRTGIFAYRAASIQINYVGFEATIGADFMDYIVSDHTCIPKDSQKHYNEKILYLPNAYMPTDNLIEISDKEISRTELGLPADGFVFACFNSVYKITPSEFDIWMQVMLQVPNSVLWLRKPNKWAESSLVKEAAKRGVDAKRIIFADKVNISDHLARHKLADLFLDTFNMNAHATAIDALWAGLPIVSKLGEGFCARAGVSYLRALDLPELVAESESDYEALILDLALNPDRLNAIRDKLNRNRLTAPLFNTECYVRDFEAGLEKAYNLYFEGKEPEHISAEKSKVTT
jgi:protein O-GlcNAc transferase